MPDEPGLDDDREEAPDPSVSSLAPGQGQGLVDQRGGAGASSSLECSAISARS